MVSVKLGFKFHFLKIEGVTGGLRNSFHSALLRPSFIAVGTVRYGTTVCRNVENSDYWYGYYTQSHQLKIILYKIL